jgi:hypothetical protein
LRKGGGGLAALFDFDHHEAVGLSNHVPAFRTLRLMARSDDPKLGRAVVNLVLLCSGRLDNRRAVGCTALAPARPQGVEAVLRGLLAGHAVTLSEGDRFPRPRAIPRREAPTLGFAAPSRHRRRVRHHRDITRTA